MIRILTFCFSLLIIAIIFIVDTGRGAYLHTLVHQIPMGDKVLHFLFMGTLSLLVNLSLKIKMTTILGRKVLLGSLIVLILVTLEELSQGFISSRNLSFADWIADFLGIVLMGRLAQWLYPQLFRFQS